MVDVQFVIAHSLWIAGAAVALAALSYYQWLAAGPGRSWREIYPECRMFLTGAVVLVASGLFLVKGNHWWEHGLWLLVGLGAALDLWRRRRAT